jgi:hypothetical protein
MPTRRDTDAERLARLEWLLEEYRVNIDNTRELSRARLPSRTSSRETAISASECLRRS